MDGKKTFSQSTEQSAVYPQPQEPIENASLKPHDTDQFVKRFSMIRPDLIYYGLVLVLAFTGKLFYSLSSVRALLFLLAPVTFLVSAFTGIPFEYHESSGFINLYRGIVIGKSCAGMNYLLLLYTTTIVCFLRYFRKRIGKILFMAVALVTSYLVCLYATATRIIVSIPLISAGNGFWFLKTDTAHKIVGIVVYLTILLLYYSAISYILNRAAKRGGPESAGQEEMSCRQ